jgi:hypothetical protein
MCTARVSDTLAHIQHVQVVDGCKVIVNVAKGSVECANADAQKKVETVLKRMLGCLFPVGRCGCE